MRADVPFKVSKNKNYTPAQLDEMIAQSNNPTLVYSMTQKFNSDANWITANSDWENKSKLYFVDPKSTFIKLTVVNDNTAKTESGGLSYYNIMNNFD